MINNKEDALQSAKRFNKDYTLLGLDMAKAYRKMYPTLMEMGKMRTDSLWALYRSCPKELKEEMKPLILAKSMKVFDELDPGHFMECARNLVNAMGGAPPIQHEHDDHPLGGLMEALESSEFFAELQRSIQDSPYFEEGGV